MKTHVMHTAIAAFNPTVHVIGLVLAATVSIACTVCFHL